MTPRFRISGISTELSQVWAGCAPGLSPSLCTSSESPLFSSRFPSRGPWTPSLHSKGTRSFQPSKAASRRRLPDHSARADSSVSKATRGSSKSSPSRRPRNLCVSPHAGGADPVLHDLSRFPSRFGTAAAAATRQGLGRCQRITVTGSARLRLPSGPQHSCAYSLPADPHQERAHRAAAGGRASPSAPSPRSPFRWGGCAGPAGAGGHCSEHGASWGPSPRGERSNPTAERCLPASLELQREKETESR